MKKILFVGLALIGLGVANAVPTSNYFSVVKRNQTRVLTATPISRWIGVDGNQSVPASSNISAGMGFYAISLNGTATPSVVFYSKNSDGTKAYQQVLTTTSTLF